MTSAGISRRHDSFEDWARFDYMQPNLLDITTIEGASAVFRSVLT